MFVVYMLYLNTGWKSYDQCGPLGLAFECEQAGLELIERMMGEMSPQGLHLTPSQYPRPEEGWQLLSLANPIVCLWKMIG